MEQVEYSEQLYLWQCTAIPAN